MKGKWLPDHQAAAFILMIPGIFENLRNPNLLEEVSRTAWAMVQASRDHPPAVGAFLGSQVLLASWTG
jgi:hypothetical protein